MEIAATRELELLNGLNPSSKVEVVLYKPIPAEAGGYKCVISVKGLAGSGLPPILGADSMQALVLAIVSLGHYIAHSEENRQGRLRWLGMKNLGFSFNNTSIDVV